MQARQGWCRAFAAMGMGLWLGWSGPGHAGLESGTTASEARVAHDGSAHLRVPLRLTPGPGGLVPRLALEWASSRRDGLAGPGWDLLGLSAITRCPRTLAQDGGAAAVSMTGGETGDRFCLEGRRLRRVAGLHGAAGTVYQTETESFLRITAQGVAGTGPATFSVEQPDGTVLTYGGTQDSRIEAADAATVRVWALSEQRDRNGNTLRIRYLEDGGPAAVSADRIGDQYGYRPSEILYAVAGNGEPAHHAVRFVYESQAEPVEAGWQAGTHVVSRQRLARIEHRHDGVLVRYWTLTREVAPEAWRVTECGPSRCRTPVVAKLAPTGFAIDTLETQPGDFSAFPQPDATLLADLDGDGRQDFLSPTAVSGYWSFRLADPAQSSGYGPRVVTNLTTGQAERSLAYDWDGDGRQDLLAPLAPVAGVARWGWARSTGAGFAPFTDTGYAVDALAQRLTVADINGDGRDDLAYAVGSPARVMVRLHEGSRPAATPLVWWTLPPGQAFCSAASNARLPDLAAMDVDADGRTDLVFCSGTAVSATSGLGFNLGGGYPGAATTGLTAVASPNLRVLLTRGSASGPVAQWLADLGETDITQPPRFADFNGDGLPDVLLRLASGAWKTRAGTGRGFAEAREAPTPGPIAFAYDADGDGATDLLEARPEGWVAYPGQRGRLGLLALAPVAIAGGERMGSGYRIGDIDGDGVPDLLGVPDADIAWQVARRGAGPSRVVAVVEGTGAEVRWSYGAACITPARPDAARPTWRPAASGAVVCRQELDDETGTQAVMAFRYGEPRRDLLRRESAGLAWREQRDERHGVVLKERFHQGFPSRGLASERRVETVNGLPIVVEEYLHAVTSNGPAGETRYWPQLQQQKRREHVLGGSRAGAPQRTTIRQFQRDAYGGLLQETVQLTDEDTLSPGFGEVHRWQTARTYQHAAGGWCLRLPVREERLHSAPDGSQLRQVREQVADSQACRITGWRELSPEGGVLRTAHWTFDACGNRQSTTLQASGLPARTEHQSFGVRCTAPENIVDAAGLATQFTWRHDLGVLTSAIDANGERWQASHDEFGRRVSLGAADGSTWSLQVQECLAKSCAQLGGRWWQTERWLGSDGTLLDEVTLHFGQRGQPTAEDRRLAGGARVRETYHWDADGELAAFSVPAWAGLPAASFSLQRDAYGRVVAVQRPRSSTDATPVRETVEYDGALTTVVDGAGARAVFRRDARGRLRSVTDPAGGTVTYRYAAAGLVEVVDAVGAPTRFEYDGLGRQTALVDAVAGRREFTLDALDQLVVERNARGQGRHFEYDNLGRIIRRVTAAEEVRWTYGTEGARHEAGRLIEISAASGTERRVYDAAGRLSRRYWPGLREDSFDFRHDAAGRLATLVYPAAADGTRLQVQHGWDGLQLVSLRNGETGAELWQARAFDPQGHVIDERLGNGIVRTAAHDPVTGRPQWQVVQAPNGTRLQDLRFEFDVRGLLLARQDDVSGRVEGFQHDLLGRLVRVTRPEAVPLSIRYDGAGNILERSDIGLFRYDAARPGRLLQAGIHTFDYDADGQVIARNGAAIDWTIDGQPAVIRAAGLASRFTYGPAGELLGQLAQFSQGMESTRYLAGFMERVTTASREHQRQAVIGPEGAVAWITKRSDGSSVVSYALDDALGNLDTLVGSSGDLHARLRYSPFGARLSAQPGAGLQPPTAAEQTAIAEHSRRGFGGQTHLDALGLVHFGRRVLDPLTGRFLSPDPAVGAGASSQDWNRYAYAWNSPYTVADPTGAIEIEVYFGAGGFGVRIGGSCPVDGSVDCVEDGFIFDPTNGQGRYFYDWDDPEFRQEIGPGVSLRFPGMDGSVSVAERLDLLQGGLNAASAGADLSGVGEPLGIALDGLNGLISLLRGEPREAAEQAFAMMPVAGTLKNLELFRRMMQKVEAHRSVNRAVRAQEGNPRYGRADRWQTTVLEPGTVLLQFGRPNDPGAYFFALSPAEAKAAGTAALYDGLQMRTSDNHGRWTQVQVYRVTRPIGGALSIAASNRQHGRGGLGQYFLTRTEGLAHVGTIDLGH